MYDCVEDSMIECGVAERLPSPVWMNKDGDIVSTKDEGFGMKVSIKITKPELCLVADECGFNTCQKGDGRHGGQRKIGERGCKVYDVISKKDRHCTMLGFTKLLGKPVMCAIIVSGKEDDLSIHAGIIGELEEVGNEGNDFYLSNNMGAWQALKDVDR